MTVTTDKKILTVYIEQQLKEKLQVLAKQRKRSLSNMVEVLLEEIVNKAEADGELK